MSTTYWIILVAVIIGIIAVIILTAFLRRRGPRQAAHGDQIYVGNLPYRMSEFDLKNCFGKYGQIKDARIVKNSRTGRSRGYAFVTFMTAQEASNALAAHGSQVKGRSIVVRIAKPAV